MSTAFDVRIDSRQLAAFKRRAIAHYKKTHGEYIEVLFIHRGVGEYHIKEFRKINILKSEWSSVEYCQKDWNRLKASAQRDGLELGSIHTHPSLHGTQPSKEDYTGIDGDILIGICEIFDPDYTPCEHCSPLDESPKYNKIHTEIDFWIPQIPCNVVMVKD